MVVLYMHTSNNQPCGTRAVKAEKMLLRFWKSGLKLALKEVLASTFQPLPQCFSAEELCGLPSPQWWRATLSTRLTGGLCGEDSGLVVVRAAETPCWVLRLSGALWHAKWCINATNLYRKFAVLMLVCVLSLSQLTNFNTIYKWSV